MTLLTVNDMATWLQVKAKTIYAWASQGKMPCVKINGVIRFDERAIAHWLEICQVPVGPPRLPAKNRRTGPATSLEHLIESATRAAYTARGETRPVASPHGKERTNGAR